MRDLQLLLQRVSFFPVFVILTSQTAFGQQPPVVNTPPPQSGGVVTSSRASTSDERYRIGPGDILEVLVYNQPQLSRPTLRVDGRGMIRMPLLEGEILAACKTESDLAKELTVRYQEYQKNPQVDIYVKEFNSQPVAIVGAVNSPGRFQLQRRIRLLELLTFAGGPSTTAGENVQIVHAPGAPMICEGESEASGDDTTKDSLSTYQLNRTMRADDSANPYLRPGDIVMVPTADQIYVMGSVNAPQAIALKDQLTVSRAIMMAGGVSKEGQQDKVKIIRQAEDGSKTTMMVNLKEINKGTAQDVALQRNDVVEVGRPGGAKAVLHTLADSIVPMATRLPLRVIY
jgi:polysaccharide export outer membrane protein